MYILVAVSKQFRFFLFQRNSKEVALLPALNKTIVCALVYLRFRCWKTRVTSMFCKWEIEIPLE